MRSNPNEKAHNAYGKSVARAKRKARKAKNQLRFKRHDR